MSFRNADRVKETSTTTGVGTYSLAGAAAGFRTFVAGVGDTNLCNYVAENGTDWEVGIGTVADAAPDTLARTLVLASSNAGAAVNWGAGTKNLFCGAIAADRNPRTLKLAANHTLSSTTATEVTGLELTNIQPGTYVAQYFLKAQSATTTVGIGTGINFTGTAAAPLITRREITTGVSAATGVLDGTTNVGTGTLVEGRSTGAYSTTAPNMINTGGVATAGENNLIVIEVLFTVTSAGNLELWHSSETATSTSIMSGSSVILTRIDD
jgi:hypothetical protein